MQKLVRVVIVAALIGLAYWGWRALFPGPEKIIRSRVRALAKTASMEPSDGMAVRGYKIFSISDFFTEDVVFKLAVKGYEPMTLDGREEVSTAAKQLSQMSGVKIEFLDANVTLDPDKQTAIVDLTAKITIHGEQDFYVQELNFMFRKVEGKWMIYRVETVRTLSRHTPLRDFRQAAAGAVRLFPAS